MVTWHRIERGCHGAQGGNVQPGPACVLLRRTDSNPSPKKKKAICDMFQKRLQQSKLENLVLMEAAMPLGNTRPPSMIRNMVTRLTLFNQGDQKQVWFTVSTEGGRSHTQCCVRQVFLNNALTLAKTLFHNRVRARVWW